MSDLVNLFQFLPIVALVFARVAALFVAGPVIGGVYIPLQAKALLALAVTLILVPLQLRGAPEVPLDLAFIAMLVKEIMVGLSLGFFLSLFYQAVRFAGDLANRHAGFAAGEYFNPDLEDIATPIGDMAYVAITLLFFLTDAHHYFFAALARSYQVVPLASWALSGSYTAALGSGLQQMSVIALALSFPVLAVIMAITVAEGVLVRAIPQINVMHFSFTVKILVALLVLHAGMPAAVAFMGVVLETMREAGIAVLPTFRG